MHLPESENPRRDGDVAEQQRSTLMIRRCTNCATLLAPMTSTCSSCQSPSLEWVPSSGRGSIVSWKMVHCPSCDGTQEWEPSTIAIVELDEGPWVYTTIAGELPSPSEQPVRVRFEPRPIGDRFPVFTVAAADEPQSARIAGRERRSAADRAGGLPRIRMKTGEAYGSAWVRSSLNQCTFLKSARSVDTDAGSVVEFAIRWAPFGGAAVGELSATFGVTRWRFVHMIREALGPRTGDSRKAQALKRDLLDALTWAWRAYPDSSAVVSHAVG